MRKTFIKHTRLELAIILGILISCILCAFTPFYAKCNDIYPNVIRLHILAESNSDQHQDVKLAIRDNVLKETANIFNSCSNYNEAISVINNNLSNIKTIAEKTLKDHNINCTVDVALNKDSLVDTRCYSNFTMPSGMYTALTIKLGEGNGKNWWCLIYPPLCIESSVSNIKTELFNDLKELEKDKNYRMEFASVELFQMIVSIISKPKTALIE